MKLAHVSLENVFNFNENSILNWLIEDSQLYYKYVRELSRQVQGEPGNFILSNKDKTLKIDTDMQILVGPFDILLNSKKISTMITKKLLKVATESEHFQKFNEISKMVNKYFFDLCEDLDFPIEIEELKEENLIKSLSIKTSESSSFLENLISYIHIILDLFRPKLLVLVDISSYIPVQDFDKFLEFIMYEDINVLFINYFKQEKVYNFSKTYFLDIDKCEFEYPAGTYTYK